MEAFIAYGAFVAAIVASGIVVGSIVSALDQRDVGRAERQNLIKKD
jgi:hypothetical protein